MFGTRIIESTFHSGTGTVTLTGAKPGFQSFKSALGLSVAGWTHYLLKPPGAAWEVGYGLLTPGTSDTLTRTKVLRSTNGNAALNLDGQEALVIGDIPPELLLWSYRAITAGETQDITDFHGLVDHTSSSSHTVTLIEGAKVHVGYRCAYRHSGNAGILTLDGNASEQIDGAATISLYPGQSVEIMWCGTAWLVVAAVGYQPLIQDWTGRSIANLTLTDPLLTGTAHGSAIGIGPEQLVVNRNLGPLAYAGTIDAGDVRGAANRIMVTDGSGIGTEGSVSGLLALVGGVLSTTAQRRDYIFLQDQKADGTAGGSATGGSAWTTRTLNTEVADTGNNCALSSNQFTLDAGTYELVSRTPFYNVGGARTRLRNITDSTTVALSENALIGNDGDYWVTLSTRFTIAGAKAFEIQYAVVTGTATVGLGNHDQQTLGPEHYASVQIYKVT